MYLHHIIWYFSLNWLSDIFMDLFYISVTSDLLDQRTGCMLPSDVFYVACTLCYRSYMSSLYDEKQLPDTRRQIFFGASTWQYIKTVSKCSAYEKCRIRTCLTDEHLKRYMWFTRTEIKSDIERQLKWDQWEISH